MTYRKTYPTLLACLLAVAVLTAPRAHAQTPLPERAVSEDTTAAIVIDADGITTAAVRATLETLLDQLPQQFAQQRQQLEQQLDAGMAELEQDRQAFLDAGGRDVVILVSAQGVAGGAAEKPLMLVHVEPGTEPDAFVQAMRAAKPDTEVTGLEKVDEQWLIDPVNGGDRLPEQASPERIQQLQEQLAKGGDAPIRVGFVASEGLKQQLQQLARQPQQMGPFTPLAQPMQKAAAGFGSLRFGERPEISQTLIFEDEQAAQQFNQGWSTILMMGQQMLSQQFGQMPNGPDAQSIQNLFNAFQMSQEGTQLTMTLDGDFLASLGDVAPSLVGPFLMMQQMQQQQMQQPAGPGMMPGGVN